ncbi:hypothetical protein [Dorea formicigenerans]|uniref:hypothetical protein n=1 Tax=Dorea formicigenerans TaxID=39486 RepID=UPI002FE57F66
MFFYLNADISRLLVKPVKSAISYMPTASYGLPYEGAKEMLLIDEVDNKGFLEFPVLTGMVQHNNNTVYGYSFASFP